MFSRGQRVIRRSDKAKTWLTVLVDTDGPVTICSTNGKRKPYLTEGLEPVGRSAEIAERTVISRIDDELQPLDERECFLVLIVYSNGQGGIARSRKTGEEIRFDVEEYVRVDPRLMVIV